MLSSPRQPALAASTSTRGACAAVTAMKHSSAPCVPWTVRSTSLHSCLGAPRAPPAYPQACFGPCTTLAGCTCSRRGWTLWCRVVPTGRAQYGCSACRRGMRVQVMVPQPTCLPSVVPVSDVLLVLSNTTHHGFPVISEPIGSSDYPDGAVGQLEGLVLRSQLLVLLRKRYARLTPRSAIERPGPCWDTQARQSTPAGPA